MAICGWVEVLSSGDSKFGIRKGASGSGGGKFGIGKGVSRSDKRPSGLWLGGGIWKWWQLVWHREGGIGEWWQLVWHREEDGLGAWLVFCGFYF